MLREMLEGRELDLKQFYLDMRKDMIKPTSKLQINSSMVNLLQKRTLNRLLKHFTQLFEKQQEMTNGPRLKAYERFQVLLEKFTTLIMTLKLLVKFKELGSTKRIQQSKKLKSYNKSIKLILMTLLHHYLWETESILTNEKIISRELLEE